MGVCPTCNTSYESQVLICPSDGTPLPASAADPHIGALIDGKYRVDAFLSAGGMGSVYRATHVMLDKTVAIKLIRKELGTTPEIVTRFQREARAASNLGHPNIANVFDFGQTGDGSLYLVMEYVSGPSVKDVIQRDGPMAPARIIAILSSVASALARAHRHHVVHRDLKPQNIMLDVDADGRETPKLLDFGIAKTFDDPADRLTLTGFALGTPHYMSPEQATGQPVDARSDIYSLGVVLYEMLVGVVPFNDTSVATIILKHLNEAPQLPSLKRPDVQISPSLESIAMRCLEKEMQRRYQSAEAFIQALEQADTVPLTVTEATTVLPATPTLSEPTVLLSSPSAAGLTPPNPTAPRSPEPSSHLASLRAGESLSSGAPAAPARPPDIADGTRPTVRVARPEPTRDAPRNDRQQSGPGRGFWIAAIFIVLAVIVSGPWAVRSWLTPAVVDTIETAPSATPAMAVSDGPAAVTETAVTPPSPAARTESAPDLGRSSRPNVPVPLQETTQAPVGQPPVPSGPESTGAPARAEHPSVFVACDGPSEICAPMRSAFADSLARDRMSAAGRGRADVEVEVRVEVPEERVTQNFGTTFVTRTYSVELVGQAGGGAIAMPPGRTFSFDAQVGRERANENARVLATDAVERIRTYWQGLR